MKEINQAIAAAQQKFGNNLLAENNAFNDKFGIPVSSYSTEMTTCSDRARREEMFKAYSSRGNNDNEYDNKALCLEILKLRAERAKMLGFPTFAAYQLDNKMARDPQTVNTFLDKIIGPAVARAKEEVYDLQKLMDRDIAAGLLPAGSKIEPGIGSTIPRKSAKRNMLERRRNEALFSDGERAQGCFRGSA